MMKRLSNVLKRENGAILNEISQIYSQIFE